MQSLSLPTHSKFSAHARFVVDGAIALTFATTEQQALSQRAVIGAWKGDHAFRDFFSTTLASMPFDAFRWETSPARCNGTDRTFESVIVRESALASVEADPTPFAQHIAKGSNSCDVVSFTNLGGDARLIVPCASSSGANFAHLAAFLRTAPTKQIHRMWEVVSLAVEDTISARTWPQFWVSTAGLGVSWLHVRIDARPKYYHYRPFAAAG